MPKIDPFFEKQPPLTFIDELRAPMHIAPPESWGRRPITHGEIDASGMYIASPCPDPLLETSWAALEHFLRVYKMEGSRYPVSVALIETQHPEAFTAEITAGGVSIRGDREGIRRALIWLEDELRRSEGAYLTPGVTERRAVIRSRITRCFFSPINRPPKYGDELSDDIDYYPEEYLNRLMHDGANGVWVYTRFSDLIESSFVPGWGKGREHRIAKLNRLIDKCARYGIGVYVFAIEPIFMSERELEQHPALKGISWKYYEEGYGLQSAHCVCVESEEGRNFVFESGKRLLESAPGLRGFISITYGERQTSCASQYKRCFDGSCPKGECPAKTHGQLLADNVEALRSGIRSVKPDCEVISWTYGHRTCELEDVREYARKAPLDVMLMQNFDDMGYEEQLGIMRQCVDYWLSYIGPSELFTVTAREAVSAGRHIYAKMQVCCSHEIASVPYVPVPGILYKKYAGARACGVEGVLQCWYFGNYPSMMSKAAGELSFIERFEDEDAFLYELAAIWWGRSRAGDVVRAWHLFEESYRQYPMNVMFSYYGPAHDSVVWKLQLEPKNRKLPRTWQTLDPIDGDRIGEALLNGHTLDEALTLLCGMSEKWSAGLEVLEGITADGDGMAEQLSVARAIGILFDSARNILEFYKLRERLGYGEGDAAELLGRMETIVRAEMDNSRRMIPLCEADGRLGYHSEGEGYKFFPEKLRDRIAYLETLLETEFVRVRERIDSGLAPLAYYAGEGEGKHYRLARTIDEAAWEPIGEYARFRGALDGTKLTLELAASDGSSFTLCPEIRLLWPEVPLYLYADGSVRLGSSDKFYYSLFGERRDEMLARYADRTTKDGVHRLNIELRDFGMDSPRPFKMRIKAGGELWTKDPDPFITLSLDEIIPGDYGWFMPPV